MVFKVFEIKRKLIILNINNNEKGQKTDSFYNFY